jgi:hypothetical protein
MSVIILLNCISLVLRTVQNCIVKQQTDKKDIEEEPVKGEQKEKGEEKSNLQLPTVTLNILAERERLCCQKHVILICIQYDVSYIPLHSLNVVFLE